MKKEKTVETKISHLKKKIEYRFQKEKPQKLSIVDKSNS